MIRHILIFGAALAALAGCGGTDATDAQANAAAAASANAANGSAGHGGEAGRPSLLLDADGILPGGSEESRIAFGANSLDAIEQVTPLLGARYERNASGECGTGPMEFVNWGSVVLAFQQGEFVGWELRRASETPWVGTPGGATIGSTRAELEAAMAAPLEVEQTSLGTEFNAGGFTGLLSADSPDATVTALWAGASCAMR